MTNNTSELQKSTEPYKAHQQTHTLGKFRKKTNAQPSLFHVLHIIIIVHHLQCFKAPTLTTSLLNDERHKGGRLIWHYKRRQPTH